MPEAAAPGATLADAAGSAAPDRCPRCGADFCCGIDRPGPCPCTTVSLPPAVLADLRQRYTGCLCLNCLAALAGGADTGR